jgi:hypothetical protein
MMIRRLFVGLACAGTLAAQTFIQMSDPQFGMFTKTPSFEHETVPDERRGCNIGRAARACLSADQRVRLLGEIPQSAEVAYRNCQLSIGQERR